MKRININIISSQLSQKNLVIEPWAEEYSLIEFTKIQLKIVLDKENDINIRLDDDLLIVDLPAGSNFEACPSNI